MRTATQYVDFTTKPGFATLWDEQAEDGSRIAVCFKTYENGAVEAKVLEQPVCATQSA